MLRATWRPSHPPRAPLAFLSRLKLPFPSLSNATQATSFEGGGGGAKMTKYLRLNVSAFLWLILIFFVLFCLFFLVCLFGFCHL